MPTYRVHDASGDDLGVTEHPASNVEPGDVVVLEDGREALVTSRVETDEAPIAALLEVAPWPKRRISAGVVAPILSGAVVFLWLLLAVGLAEDCAGEELLCFGAGDVFALLALPALGVWASACS